MKKTQWFASCVEPVYVGVYEIHTRYYSKWDGKDWYWGYKCPLDAEKSRSPKNRLFWASWRGLAEKPE